MWEREREREREREFSCLDYFFNVLISWIYNLSLYNWFCHICITWYLISCSCVYNHYTVFDICFFESVLLIHVCLLVHVTCHSFYHSLGSFLTLRTFMFRSWSLGLSGPICRGPSLFCGAVDRLWLLVQLLLINSRDFSYSSWASLVLFRFMYLFVNYTASWWCNIPVILYHVLW